MAGIPSPTEAVRSALKIILGTAIVNRKEPISSTLIPDQISSSNFDGPVELRHITLYVLSFAPPPPTHGRERKRNKTAMKLKQVQYIRPIFRFEKQNKQTCYYSLKINDIC